MEAGNTSTAVVQENSVLNRVHSNIDRLPDDILITILSLLTVEEAAATSILSRRWRYLWMHTTGCWSFDFSEEVKVMVDKMGVSTVMDILLHHSFGRCYEIPPVPASSEGGKTRGSSFKGLWLSKSPLFGMLISLKRFWTVSSPTISAANLELFTYLGPNIDVPFGSGPHCLLEATIGGSFGESFVFGSAKHLVYISQLETLTFDVSFEVNLRISSFPNVF
ncbi:uncharacterized protein [Coffea arabica]|uniref:F-box domain-containing protein n=1 Tax=Coffea arabica TaxID=13443 RepID=A0ABM4U6I5_COFAR